MNYLPYIVVWGVLAVVVLVLAIYRWIVSNREDDSLHVLEGEESTVREQVEIGKKLDRIDKWGKLLTIIVVVYGLVLAGVYFYELWQRGSSQVLLG